MSYKLIGRQSRRRISLYGLSGRRGHVSLQKPKRIISNRWVYSNNFNLNFLGVGESTETWMRKNDAASNWFPKLYLNAHDIDLQFWCQYHKAKFQSLYNRVHYKYINKQDLYQIQGLTTYMFVDIQGPWSLVILLLFLFFVEKLNHSVFVLQKGNLEIKPLRFRKSIVMINSAHTYN